MPSEVQDKLREAASTIRASVTGMAPDSYYEAELDRILGYSGLVAKWEAAMRGLESLTPNGSEFVNDVKTCVAYAQNKQHTLHDIIVKATLRAKAAEEQRDGWPIRLAGDRLPYRRCLECGRRLAWRRLF